MANSNVYMIPDGATGSSQLDPNMLYATLMNNGNGGFGGNGNWMWIIFLFFLYPLIQNGGWFGNNNGGSGLGSLGNMVNNNDGRELLMQAISGNGSAIDNLASMFNTTSQNIMQAINTVNSSVSQVGNTVGLTGQQVISAVNAGNSDILHQLCQTTCGIRESITAGNYQNQIATLQQTQTLGTQISGVQSTLANEFCRQGYEMAQQFCDTRQNSTNNTQSLKDATNAQTQAILGKLDAMENQAMQDKITDLTAQNTALTTQINLANQNAVTAQTVANAVNPLAAQLSALTSKVSAIENKQPDTITTQYSPYTVVPNYSLYGYGYGYGAGNAWT